MITTSDDYRSSIFAKCPNCDFVQDINFDDMYVEGNHTIFCDGCLTPFTVVVSLRYEYTSTL
jgi:hypothetical protein